MGNRFKRFDWQVVAKGRVKSYSGSALFLVKPISSSVFLEGTTDSGVTHISLAEGTTALIGNIGKLRISSTDGPWRFQYVSLASFMKLCAFMDHSAGIAPAHANESKCAITYIDSSSIGSKDIEAWLIGAVLRGDKTVCELLELIRTQEPYHLVRFLLSEHTETKTVSALGERYGLSKSHFNRLCREVLGNGVKRELRQWRAVEAMLEVVEHREGMAAIAFEYGFSSASHFSREIKQLFGVSPRRLFACTDIVHKED